jgi:hypothetical protein
LDPALAMLAYVFWHWPVDPAADRARYEEAQRAFHAALADAGSEGLLRSFSFRVAGTAWLPVEGAYEDWYLVAGSFALDPLNEVAVSPRLRPAHDSAARSAAGAGGLYRLRSGVPEPRSGAVHWLRKPAGESYDRFYARFPPDAVLWRRQMVLGPAPEFLLDSGEPPEGLEALRADRELLFS